MLLKYLGTAAAEGMPAVFCRCDVCNKARRLGGKNIRTRSQILIDGNTLIDFPPDSYMHALRFDLDLSAVTDVFITHAHMDHCYPQDFTTHCAPYAHNMSRPTINVYGNATVLKKFIDYTADEIREAAKNSIALHELKPYESVAASSGLKVTALPAVHTKGENCLLYALQKDGKTALIMNDTGILDISVYEKMKELSLCFDLVGFDCTYGDVRHGPGRHMGLSDNVAEREKMIKLGLVKPSTKYVVTHFSHNNGLLHEDMNYAAERYGMVAAYDGMEIEI